MFVLARRGLTMLRAKRTIEALLEDGRVFVELPTVEDPKAVTDDLARAGIAAAPVEPPRLPERQATARAAASHARTVCCALRS